MGKSFSSILLFFFCISCQTHPAAEFRELQIGMDKGQVLDTVGNPQRTQRWKGMDRWTYIYLDENNSRKENEVHFLSGYSIYVGPKPIPEISAEEQDYRNFRENKEVYEAWATRYSEWQKASRYRSMVPEDRSDREGVLPSYLYMYPSSTK